MFFISHLVKSVVQKPHDMFKMIKCHCSALENFSLPLLQLMS